MNGVKVAGLTQYPDTKSKKIESNGNRVSKRHRRLFSGKLHSGCSIIIIIM
jgi:hypothetical protein